MDYKNLSKVQVFFYPHPLYKTTNQGETMSRYRYLTCESVGAGHPDKVADRISDTILDYFMGEDYETKAGIETFITNSQVIVGGEVHSAGLMNQELLELLVLNAFMSVGYANGKGEIIDNCGMDKDYKVINLLKKQSPDIRQGVELGNGEIGAGDQGMMIGYANRDTPSFMPLALQLANSIMTQIKHNREILGKESNLLPDGKCQITLVYKNGAPIHIETIVVSNQTKEDNREQYEKEIRRAIDNTLNLHKQYFRPKTDEEQEMFKETKILINPTGSFLIGGPEGDVGLTGRKIVADQYGSCSAVGGGAFSGKDPSKVDRSGAYMARCLAVNIMEVLKCHEVSVEIAYAIGVADPVGLNIKTDGKADWLYKALQRMEEVILESRVCTPRNIEKRFGLHNIKYTKYSSFGHFGRNAPWDKVYDDLTSLLRSELEKVIE